MNQLFESTTIVNFGENMPPPTLKYIDKKQISKEDVEITMQTVTVAPIKADEFYSRTGFTKPADDEIIF